LLNGENVLSVYLKASIETLFNRLVINKAKTLIANKKWRGDEGVYCDASFERSLLQSSTTYKVLMKTVETVLIFLRF
jgi:shikimate kinase